jgi:hypothetical protein
MLFVVMTYVFLFYVTKTLYLCNSYVVFFGPTFDKLKKCKSIKQTILFYLGKRKILKKILNKIRCFVENFSILGTFCVYVLLCTVWVKLPK